MSKIGFFVRILGKAAKERLNPVVGQEVVSSMQEGTKTIENILVKRRFGKPKMQQSIFEHVELKDISEDVLNAFDNLKM